jgi:hypothetical protein
MVQALIVYGQVLQVKLNVDDTKWKDTDVA